MASTLLLDTASWDLIVDINGDIAIANEPYSLAQDAASAIKTFGPSGSTPGEVYYDTTIGVPYRSILGQSPPIPLLKAELVEAAETVPDVDSAQCFISSISQRVLTGQVQITSKSPTTAG